MDEGEMMPTPLADAGAEAAARARLVSDDNDDVGAEDSPSRGGGRRSHRGKRGGKHTRSAKARRASDMAVMSASSSSSSLVDDSNDTAAATAATYAILSPQRYRTPMMMMQSPRYHPSHVTPPRVPSEDARDHILDYTIAAPHACPDGATEASRRSKATFNTLPTLKRAVKKRNAGSVLISNANNFVKAALIMEYVATPRSDPRKKVPFDAKRVLDLGCNCNKDIAKYTHGKPSWVLGVDIAEAPFVEGERRWKKLKMPYPTAFVCADFTAEGWWRNMAVRLFYSQSERVHGECREAIPYQSITLDKGCVDVVSAQMSVQYAFANEASAGRFLDAVAALLCKGGHFIGTMPDIEFLRTRLSSSPKGVYQTPYITITCDPADVARGIRTHTPYTFQMNDGTCEDGGIAEYAVEMTTLMRMCQSRGLRFVTTQNYVEYLKYALEHSQLRHNRERMRAFGLDHLSALPQLRNLPSIPMVRQPTPPRHPASPATATAFAFDDPAATVDVFDAILMFQVFCFQKI